MQLPTLSTGADKMENLLHPVPGFVSSAALELSAAILGVVAIALLVCLTGMVAAWGGPR